MKRQGTPEDVATVEASHTGRFLREALEREGRTTAAGTPRARRAYGVDKDLAKGVVVTHVKPVSPAADANLQEGDVILEVNGAAVGAVDELQAAMKKAPKGKYVRFYVQRQGPRGPQKFLTAVKPEE